MNELTITKANEDDLPAIIDVQKKAFLEVVKTFHLKSVPPLEQSIVTVQECAQADRRPQFNV